MKNGSMESRKNHGALKHWVALRISAVIAIPLCVWLVYSIVSLARADHQTFVSWLSRPANAFEMSFFVIVIFYHAALGCHEIVEDYISDSWKRVNIAGLNLFFALAGAFSLASIIKIAFGP